MNDSRYRHIFSDLPVLETDRLILKKIEQENAADMFAYASLGETTRYLLWSPHLNMDETRGYIEYLRREYKKGNYGDWGITLKENNVFIGTIGFADIDLKNNSGELGYVLNPAYQGKGYMQEAMKRLLSLCFEQLLVKRIQLRIMQENLLSVHLAERVGFVKEGTLRDLLLVKGKYRTIHIYSMTDNDYFGAPPTP